MEMKVENLISGLSINLVSLTNLKSYYLNIDNMMNDIQAEISNLPEFIVKFKKEYNQETDLELYDKLSNDKNMQLQIERII